MSSAERLGIHLFLFASSTSLPAMVSRHFFMRAENTIHHHKDRDMQNERSVFHQNEAVEDPLSDRLGSYRLPIRVIMTPGGK